MAKLTLNQALEFFSNSEKCVNNYESVMRFAATLPHPTKGKCFIYSGKTIASFSNQIAEILEYSNDKVLVKMKVFKKVGKYKEVEYIADEVWINKSIVFRPEDRDKIEDYKGESVKDINNKLKIKLLKLVPSLINKGWAIRINNDYDIHYYGTDNKNRNCLEVHSAYVQWADVMSPKIYLHINKNKSTPYWEDFLDMQL